MSFALNEVEATAKKATRGAGYPWGLAEEAAKATRWLCAQGLDGVAILAGALTRDSEKYACPIAEGARLSDQATALSGQEVSLNDVAQPAMLLAFAALAARQIGRCVTIECDQTKAVTDGCQMSLSGEFPPTAEQARVYVGGNLGDALLAANRASPNGDAWVELNQLAHRTYAPATEESRLLGAGAGLSDND